MTRYAINRTVPAGVERGRSFLIKLLMISLLSFSPSVLQSAPSLRPDLEEIFGAVKLLTRPIIVDGLPIYSADTIQKKKEQLRDLRTRFNTLNPDNWTARDQVDYLLVRSELDKVEYGLYVYRAPSRNPNFYLSSVSSFAFEGGATLSRLGRLLRQPPPFDAARAEAILEQMHRIPHILEQAKQNLTEPTVEMSRRALPTLENAREASLAFAEALSPYFPAEQAPKLRSAAVAMGGALAAYREWIERHLPNMAHVEPSGKEMYDWILQRIWLVPYDARDILRFGEQEYARYLSFTEFEEVRNRGLQWPRPAATTAVYAARTAADEQAIRVFLDNKDVLTIPDYVGPYRRTLMPEYIQAFSLFAGLSGYSAPGNRTVKYSVPEDHPYAQTYWESIMRIDPSTNIFHDGIPGHHFQGIVSSRHPSPVRAQRRDRFKSEGWCTYWEETAMQLGFYDDRSRSRELIYNFLRLRALRVIVDVKMALGDMTLDEGISALMAVPMDRRIASEEAADFIAVPTDGIVYQIGKLQIERLLAERRNDLGERFDLGRFHDELVTAAWVPIALTRFEMTGRNEQVLEMLADTRPIPRPTSDDR